MPVSTAFDNVNVRKNVGVRHITKLDYEWLRNEIIEADFEQIYNDNVDIEDSNLTNLLMRLTTECRRAYFRGAYKEPICPWMTT